MLFRPFSALIAGALFGLTLAGGAQADNISRPKAVVELFTSQGCASCPPADALLTSLAEQGDVVALAYHVDYWDYIGWEDTFGSKGFSDLQRGYARNWGSSRIFTPQMVINGAEGVVGSKRAKVQAALANAELPLYVSLSVQGDMLKLDVPANAALQDATIYLVRYLDRADVAIEKGENAGKSMVYTQVVVDRQIVGMWEASAGAEVKLPLEKFAPSAAGGVAILIQQERDGLPGPILGAATYAF
ncbi:DUF1223 domain-containing protein [Devosia sediminis]|uniref:DUF1223 domain-containing protein n=1 Tax=Devosia sediminis TaxID=2798801 RepID=A0A934MIT6_9HYPH|nr:DUF1223 domain-containing protein [Devosia sediminis]MBJ3786557.1 DUF1223 domain-containing protein [Devosia sediminis]